MQAVNRDTRILDRGEGDTTGCRQVADLPPLEVHDRRLKVGPQRDQVRLGRQLGIGLADGPDDGLGNFGSAPPAARSRIAARVPIVTAMGGVYRRPHAVNAALQPVDDRGRQYPAAEERARSISAAAKPATRRSCSRSPAPARG